MQVRKWDNHASRHKHTLENRQISFWQQVEQVTTHHTDRKPIQILKKPSQLKRKQKEHDRLGLQRKRLAEKVSHQPTGKEILCYEAVFRNIHLILTVGRKNNPSRNNVTYKWPEKMLSLKLNEIIFNPYPNRRIHQHTHTPLALWVATAAKCGLFCLCFRDMAFLNVCCWPNIIYPL